MSGLVSAGTDLEEHERDDGGRARGDVRGEVERAEDGRRAEEGGEEREDGEEVQLRDEHHLRWVQVVPVPQLVRCVLSVLAGGAEGPGEKGAHRGRPRPRRPSSVE